MSCELFFTGKPTERPSAKKVFVDVDRSQQSEMAHESDELLQILGKVETFCFILFFYWSHSEGSVKWETVLAESMAEGWKRVFSSVNVSGKEAKPQWRSKLLSASYQKTWKDTKKGQLVRKLKKIDLIWHPAQKMKIDLMEVVTTQYCPQALPLPKPEVSFKISSTALWLVRIWHGVACSHGLGMCVWHPDVCTVQSSQEQTETGTWVHTVLCIYLLNSDITASQERLYQLPKHE